MWFLSRLRIPWTVKKTNEMVLKEAEQTCLPVPIFAGHTDFGPQSRFPDFMRGCTDFGRCGNF